MTIPTEIFLNGKPVKNKGSRFAVINPATEAGVAEVASAEISDVEKAVGGAQKAYEQVWRDLAPGKRTETLFQISRLIRENAEELAQLEVCNIGKPITDARDEMGLGARVF